jgi:purine/pyrimidine-nucleoside phosphorylase
MSEFANVTVVKEANLYFEGKVASHTLRFPDGSRKTLGVMQPGEFEFSTDAAEVMEIQSGRLEWRLKGESSWRKVAGGDSFHVPPRSVFLVKVPVVTDYCCSFLP